eukprot:g27546.t1
MAKANVSAASNASETEAPEQSHEPDESRGALPSIRQERRKVGGVEEDGHDDGTVLPPIGTLKGKRDSKTKTFKTAANASLQKPMHGTTVHGSMAPPHAEKGLGVLTSKGFSGTGSTTGGANTQSSMASADPMSPGPAADKMNSTWAPNSQRRYVSPFGAKIGLTKKR